MKEAGECLNAANRLFKAAVLVFVAAALCFNAFAEQAGKVKEITPRFRRHVTEYYKHNTDAVGWLNVPGTNISDVVAQNPPNNNAFYLTHDFFGRPDRDGIFAADRRCSLIRGGELSRNTTIYGHTWDEDPHGNLFHQLKRFQDPNFAKDHPYIFFSTEDKDMAFEIFAVYYTTTDLPYIIPDLSWGRFASVIQVAFASSLYNYGIPVNKTDKVLTLSTCTYDVPGVGRLSVNVPNKYRFVIMAKLVDGESPRKEKASIKLNKNIMPVHSQPTIIRDDPEFLRILESYRASITNSK